MRIARFTFTPYELPLVRPWRTSQGTFTSRYGCLVALHSRRGEVGAGEMAPLAIPDVKTEAEISYTLERLRNTRNWPRLELELKGLDEWCTECGIQLERFPDLTFAVQCALAGLWSVRFHKPLRKLLNPTARMWVPANAVIPAGELAETVAAAAKAVAAGNRTLKLKVGVRPVDEDLKLLTELRAMFPDLRLRVDANSAWTFRDAKRFLRAALPLRIEYVEDPLRTPSAASLKALAGRLYAPIGRDETSPLAGEAWFSPFTIIKPARFATFTALKQITDTAAKNGSNVIMTGSFESSVGLSYVAVCAAAFGSRAHAHGLGTASWLAEDTLARPVTLTSRAEVRIPDINDLSRFLLPRYKDELGIAT